MKPLLLILCTALAAHAQIKISELPSLTPTGSASTVIVQSGTTGRATVSALLATGSLTYQPLDTDLTSIAALSTTSFGRSLLTQADASAARTTLGLGTAATSATGDFVAATSGTATGVTLSGTTTANGAGQYLLARRIWMDETTSNSDSAIHWGTLGNGNNISFRGSSQELIVSSRQRVAIVSDQRFGGDGFIQLGNNSPNGEIVFISQEGSATSTYTRQPSHRLNFNSAWWNGSASVDRVSTMVARPDASGNAQFEFYAAGSSSTGTYTGTATNRYTINSGTLAASIGVAGINAESLGVQNVGTGITFTGTGAAATINNLGGTAGKWTTANTTGIAASGSNSDITALTAIATSSAGAGGIAAPSGARLRFSGTGSSSSVRIDLNGSEMISMGSGGGTQFAIGSGLSLVMVNGTIAFSTAGTGITGTVLANNANAGIVGEHISSNVASGSAVSLTTATSANVTSISLTAGDWDVMGNVNFAGSSATVTGAVAGISTTSATLPTDGTEVFSSVQTTTTTATDGITLPRKRISIASTTTVFLVGQSTFSAGTVGAFGSITARRVR